MIRSDIWYALKDYIDVFSFVNEVRTQYPNCPAKKINHKLDLKEVKAVCYNSKVNQVLCSRNFDETKVNVPFEIYYPEEEE